MAVRRCRRAVLSRSCACSALRGAELRVRGNELASFEVAGADGKFHPAQAELTAGGVVVVDGKNIREIRFAWRNEPKDANLVNADGLPASPFWVKKL